VVGDGVGLSEGDGVGLSEGDGVGLSEGDGDGPGVGVSVGTGSGPPVSPVSPEPPDPPGPLDPPPESLHEGSESPCIPTMKQWMVCSKTLFTVMPMPTQRTAPMSATMSPYSTLAEPDDRRRDRR
jgi:hypothetical protein